MDRRILSLFILTTGCNEYEIYKMENADIFYQLDASEVDILLVVDNSCSMAPYQQKLAQNFDNFLTFFIEGNVDYQIGVTTTTVQEIEYNPGYPDCTEQMIAEIPPAGELVGGQIITPDTPNADTVFSDIVSVGTCGAGYEMGLESARLALQGADQGTINQGFLRDSAFLSIIFVSDEQDGSPLPVNEYLTAFRDAKARPGQRADMNASALVVNDIAECSSQQIGSGAVEGTRYVDVAQQAEGLIGNICGDDFESIVTELSLNSSRLTDTFILSSEPDPNTIAVNVLAGGTDGYELPCADGAWIFTRIGEGDRSQPAIVFDRAQMPPPNSKITVQYDNGSGDPANFCTGG